jgi:hypothetical protein
MTIEEIEALIQGYLEPNGVDSDDFLRGRSEGHADIACALTKALDCESEKLNLTGLLRRARSLRDATFQQFQELMLLSRRTENEPHPMDAMPILLAYANGIVSQGRARELLLLWLRGAGAEELDSIIPKNAPQPEIIGELNRLLSRIPDPFKWSAHNFVGHPLSEILHLVGLSRASTWMHDATSPVSMPNDQQSEVERLRGKLKKIENLSKHAWEQVHRNPVNAKELFWLIYHHSK